MTLNEQKYECKVEKDIRYINRETDPKKPADWLAAPDFVNWLVSNGKLIEFLELVAKGHKIIEKDKKFYKKLK